MTAFSPWSPLRWILPKISVENWTLVGGASFEDRCTAIATSLPAVARIAASFFLRIDDPPSRFSREIATLTERNLEIVKTLLPAVNVHRESLRAEPSKWVPIAAQIAAQSGSIVIDISTLPKRVWLFLIKRFLDSPTVTDLVVCYTRPQLYPEGPLTQDALPVESIPGHGRIIAAPTPTLVVGIGYVAFNVNELVEQSGNSKLKFIFPFPPGSPAFRRNWKLVDQLMPDARIPLEIRRIHAMDMFAALSWLRTVGSECSGMLDMVALGPKPHALAMGLAYRGMRGKAQVLYSQPLIYRPDYSKGIGVNSDGSAASFGYCLRRGGTDLF